MRGRRRNLDGDQGLITPDAVVVELVVIGAAATIRGLGGAHEHPDQGSGHRHDDGDPGPKGRVGRSGGA